MPTPGLEPTSFVHPEHAGSGIATTLARDALDNAFGRLGLHRAKDSFHAELGWVDGYTYAILAEEWDR